MHAAPFVPRRIVRTSPLRTAYTVAAAETSGGAAVAARAISAESGNGTGLTGYWDGCAYAEPASRAEVATASAMIDGVRMSEEG